MCGPPVEKILESRSSYLKPLLNVQKYLNLYFENL